jgi:carbon storage regulator
LQGSRDIQLPTPLAASLLDSLENGRIDEPARKEHIMLVLSRRVGEEIVIADDIRLTIVAVKGQRVRLGIAAPRSVPVARQELLARSPDSAQPQANSRTGM